VDTILAFFDHQSALTLGVWQDLNSKNRFFENAKIEGSNFKNEKAIHKGFFFKTHLCAMHYANLKMTIISFEDIVFWLKSYLILFPS
jgi:hypothetical protein